VTSSGTAGCWASLHSSMGSCPDVCVAGSVLFGSRYYSGRVQTAVHHRRLSRFRGNGAARHHVDQEVDCEIRREAVAVAPSPDVCLCDCRSCPLSVARQSRYATSIDVWFVADDTSRLSATEAASASHGKLAARSQTAPTGPSLRRYILRERRLRAPAGCGLRPRPDRAHLLRR